MALIPAAVGSSAGAASLRPGGRQAIVHAPRFGHRVSRGTDESTNWGGYAVQSASKFTDVAGSWVEPTVTCSSQKAQYAAFWVGIDGYSSSSVEQIGTDSDCTGRSRPSYYAWYEMYPADSVELSTSQYPVSAGDSLSASVSVAGSNFTLTLRDVTKGWTFQTTQSGSGLAQSSAEWIAESPEICSYRCSLAQLADFGTMSFTNTTAATGGASEPISAFTADGGPQEITCVTSSGTVRAQPSPLGAGGNSFSMTWEHD